MNILHQPLPSPRFIIAVALLSCLLASCKPVPAIVSPGVPPELKHSWEVSFNRGDADAVAALYAPEAQLLMSGAPPVRGTQNIKKAVQGIIDSGAKVRIDAEENLASGELAYVFGSYRMTQGEAGSEIEHGSYTEIWRRRNGVWAITLDVNASGVSAIGK